MANQALAIATLIAVLALLGCSQQDSGSTSSQASPTAKVSKSNASEKPSLIDLERRAATGDASAQLSLAKALLQTPSAGPDFGRVTQLLLGAIKGGLPEAMIGLLLLRNLELAAGDGVPESKVLRQQALDSGDRFATLFIFSPYLAASNPPNEQTIKLLEEVAASGHPLAQSKFAQYRYWQAQSVYMCHLRQDAEPSIARPKSGSARPDFSKYGVLVTCPEKKEGELFAAAAVQIASQIDAQKDPDAEAFRFWRSVGIRFGKKPTAATGGSPLSALVTEHVSRQRDPYVSELSQGLARAGEILAEGFYGLSELRPDHLRAKEFLEKAARLGEDDAQYLLATMYRDGKGVAKDLEMAARYFSQAANQGHEKAARSLGLAFARGDGVAKDGIRAYFWLNVASMGQWSQIFAGLPEGPEMTNRRRQMGDPAYDREVVARMLKPEEITEAQRLTRDWRPSPQKGAPPELSSLNAAVPSPQTPAKLGKKGTGTLFVVSATGHAVTNHHVVAGCSELRIDGRDGLGKVVTEDAVNDLALVQISGETNATAAIASEPGKLRQGEDIVVFGFPLNSVLSSGGNLTPGVLSALTGLGNNTNQIQITAPIQPGSSGSPVLNRKGEVVGVVSMKLSDSKMAKATGSVGQNVNFAVNGQTLKTFLDTHKVAYRSGRRFFSWDKSTADLADEARKWTLLVECWK